ncbi:TIR-like protein FxsC [Streptomyces sp. NPDC052016]|uniref:TIR-like protein FxsC n=1 Tax=unclassified Streptomyces TaxID=2593676 RepID=UPI0034172F4A
MSPVTDSGPVFFLSYARTPGGLSGLDLDRPVVEFYDDLRREVARLTGEREPDVGYIERRDAPSDAWRPALAASRVFVPLFAPRYFSDPVCGRQWTAFRHRMGPDYDRVVVPVVWIPRTAGSALPLAALDVQTQLPREDGAEQRHALERYAESGLYQLMELEDDDRRAYRHVVTRLAERIVRSAAEAPARPGGAEQPGERRDLGDAFAPRPPKPALRITVLAPVTSRLPPGRDAARYGSDAAEWRPYGSATGPLSQQAVAVARNLGFAPEIVPFGKARESLATDESANGRHRPVAPWVLVVDAWVLGDLKTAKAVQRIDRANRAWLAVMAVLADDDPQTRQHGERLRSLLEDTLSRHRNLRGGRLTARGTAARGIPNADAFAWLFAELAQSCYMRYLDDIQDFSPRLPSNRARSHGGSEADQ